jgi:heptose I phosphotransferase
MLAVRELEGYAPLHEFIPRRFGGLESSTVRQLRRDLTRRLADIATRLHSAQLYHCDFYLCHFFVRDLSDAQRQPGPPTTLVSTAPRASAIVATQQHGAFDLVLIDLMRLKYSRVPRWQVKDLAQLLFSSELPGITRTDRLRFFKHYLGLARLDSSARRLLRRVQWKASVYQRHNRSLARRAPGGVIRLPRTSSDAAA